MKSENIGCFVGVGVELLLVALMTYFGLEWGFQLFVCLVVCLVVCFCWYIIGEGTGVAARFGCLCFLGGVVGLVSLMTYLGLSGLLQFWVCILVLCVAVYIYDNKLRKYIGWKSFLFVGVEIGLAALMAYLELSWWLQLLVSLIVLCVVVSVYSKADSKRIEREAKQMERESEERLRTTEKSTNIDGKGLRLTKGMGIVFISEPYGGGFDERLCCIHELCQYATNGTIGVVKYSSDECGFLVSEPGVGLNSEGETDCDYAGVCFNERGYLLDVTGGRGDGTASMKYEYDSEGHLTKTVVEATMESYDDDGVHHEWVCQKEVTIYEWKDGLLVSIKRMGLNYYCDNEEYEGRFKKDEVKGIFHEAFEGRYDDEFEDDEDYRDEEYRRHYYDDELIISYSDLDNKYRQQVFADAISPDYGGYIPAMLLGVGPRKLPSRITLKGSLGEETLDLKFKTDESGKIVSCETSKGTYDYTYERIVAKTEEPKGQKGADGKNKKGRSRKGMERKKSLRSRLYGIWKQLKKRFK